MGKRECTMFACTLLVLFRAVVLFSVGFEQLRSPAVDCLLQTLELVDRVQAAYERPITIFKPQNATTRHDFEELYGTGTPCWFYSPVFTFPESEKGGREREGER